MSEFPVTDGDIEDPFVWQSDRMSFALVRDITGLISGKAWASIALIVTEDWLDWRPAGNPHICNRSVPLGNGVTKVMHRLERPNWHQDTNSGGLLIMASLEEPNSTATIRGFRADPQL